MDSCDKGPVLTAILASEKLDVGIRKYLCHLSEIPDMKIGASVLVLLDPYTVMEESVTLPAIVSTNLVSRPTMSHLLPPGMENLLAVEPTLEELAELVACPAVLRIQLDAGYVLHENAAETEEDAVEQDGGEV